MVTLAGTQNLNEFELHLRAVLGIPIPAVTFERMGASAVILSAWRPPRRVTGAWKRPSPEIPAPTSASSGKPSARVNRRMGVVVGYEPHGSSLEALRERGLRRRRKSESHRITTTPGFPAASDPRKPRAVQPEPDHKTDP